MQHATSAKPSVKEWLLEELVSFSYLAAYLFVCFAALLYFKFAILEMEGVSFAPWGFAAIKAIIVAKFMLISRRLEPYRLHDSRPLIFPTLYKSLTMLVVLIILMVIEESVMGLIHGRTIRDTIAEMGGGTMHQRIATIAIMLLIFIPFFATRALGDRIGHRKLVRMYFSQAESAANMRDEISKDGNAPQADHR